MGRNKEQAARMLGHLVANAARLVRPYMDPILKVLTLELPYGNQGVSCPWVQGLEVQDDQSSFIRSNTISLL